MALYYLRFNCKGGETKKVMISKTQRTAIGVGLTLMALALPSQAFGVNFVPTEISPIQNIIKLVQGVIRFILVVAFILAFLFLIIGGVRWITAGGDEKAVAGARGMITGALIGLVIVLVAYALIRTVEIFFGVNIITGSNFSIPQVPTGL